MNVFRIWCTIRELLSDRGYIIPADLQVLTLYDKWVQHFNFVDNNSYPLLDQTYIISPEKEKIWGDHLADKSIYVSWVGLEDLNVKFLWQLFKKLKTLNIYHVIILYENKITDKARLEISNQTIDKDPTSKLQLRIEIMPRENYIINITKHIDQPKFEIMSSDQKKEILRIHKTTPSKMPSLRTSDPISKYYGFVKGQVIKITRKDELITYRIVA